MGRPRKDTASTSSPRQAAAVPKATPAAPRSSASSQAKVTPAATRPKSAPASRSEGSGRRQPEKPASAPATSRTRQSSSQPSVAAAHGSDAGDAQRSYKASARGPAATGKPPSTKGKAPASTEPSYPGRSQSSRSQAVSKTQDEASKFPRQLMGKDIQKVEEETRGQRDNPKWYEWRENRITASVAHRIANSKFVNNKTSEVPQSYLKAVVSSGSSVQTPAMSWGVQNEKVAVQAYEELKSKSGKPVKVDDCGLFIHPGKEWIAASPDGVIKEVGTGKVLGLLEVKCPYKHRNKMVSEACKDKDFCLQKEGDSYALKKNHAYFTQVQCQLAATGLEKADFVVHTNKETAITTVDFDEAYWDKTVPKLEKFYTEAVIPYLEEKGSPSVWAKEE
ncbi:uncharacterized protein LOC102576115 [Alligator mississippiensis]|uniref:YqaJ viral recombinase domain-containing protein n=1 Tax=Alligator mississippiensis TaxID=8496 RepID=A0A151PDN6_ALLMI|nr:uncharacterized protein LOC102576115 [Alligator mississippiensis]XP_006260840.1 uncharacterized protein LOC102576115 [Alligator mississippiensis]XP_019351963.1 uncharacterized protein LOC102576115 [Alligator mississippiensis]KYO47201.1 hypothetical protein Y1Q_0002211 [Alligator mississippiensis]